MVGCRRLPAAVASPAVMAVRRRRLRVRTRGGFARVASARSRECAARFKKDFFFFFTFGARPWGIYCSFCVSLKLLTLNEAWGFVNELRILLSSLVRNVPLFTSLEVSPFFALLLSLGPPPERSPAPRFERRV